MPNHYIGDLLHTIGISGLSRVRTELSPLATVVALAPHPIRMHRLFAMAEPPFAHLACVRIHQSNLLRARMIVTTYNQNVRLSPEATLRERR
jgi:hypothetical protein